MSAVFPFLDSLALRFSHDLSVLIRSHELFALWLHWEKLNGDRRMRVREEYVSHQWMLQFTPERVLLSVTPVHRWLSSSAVSTLCFRACNHKMRERSSQLRHLPPPAVCSWEQGVPGQSLRRAAGQDKMLLHRLAF